MGAERSYLGGTWDAGWILEPQWGPEKFNFISVFLPGIFRLSLPLAVPDVWLWPV